MIQNWFSELIKMAHLDIELKEFDKIIWDREAKDDNDEEPSMALDSRLENVKIYVL